MAEPEGIKVSPSHILTVRLYKGQTREIDVRALRRVVRDVEIEEAPRREGHPTVSLEFLGGADPLVIHHSEYDRVLRAWRIQQERRAAPGEVSTQTGNVEDLVKERNFVDAEKLHAWLWYPAKDAKGRPGAVVLQLDVTLAEIPFSFVRRFHTRGSLDQLIDALIARREDVWPTT